jgi:hypothetical protein
MGGGGAQRPGWCGNEPEKTGARSARARTRGQNPLVELDFQSLIGLLCTAALIGWDPATPPPSSLPPHMGSYTRALLVSQDRRHLFVTPWPVLIRKGNLPWELRWLKRRGRRSIGGSPQTQPPFHTCPLTKCSSLFERYMATWKQNLWAGTGAMLVHNTFSCVVLY